MDFNGYLDGHVMLHNFNFHIYIFSSFFWGFFLAPSDMFYIDTVVYGIPSNPSILPKSQNSETLGKSSVNFHEIDGSRSPSFMEPRLRVVTL